MRSMRVSARVGFRWCMKHLREDHTLQSQDARNVISQNGRVAHRHLFLDILPAERWATRPEARHECLAFMSSRRDLLFVPTYPALKRWAKLFRTSGAGG